MKLKKLSLTMIFLALTIVAYIAASVICCYTTKPAVTTGEFPFSITYEYKGETKTLSGVLECEFYRSYTINGEHRRYWNQAARYDNPENVDSPNVIDQNDELQTILSIYENMSAGYCMGDPLYQDKSAHEDAEPYVTYYDYINDISLNDENREEILTSIGFKLIDFTCAEPIENSFSFSGIQYEADHVTMLIAISTVFFLLCLIFVRKDQDCEYVQLDKLGITFNFLVGILAIPFVSIICMLFGLVESRIELFNQIVYNIPSISILCLAFSVVFRRKGYSKPGFIIQFGCIPLFLLMLIL